MARDTVDAHALADRDELVAWMAAGCKPKADWRIGTEHEKFPYRKIDLSPIPYAPAGIESVLEGLRQLSGWQPIMDGKAIIGLADPRGGGAISLEPGGQFELSGAPLADLHGTATELDAHLDAVKAAADPLGISFLGLGASPLWTRDETPAMPKSRYAIMTKYMPKVGSRGLDMMYRTCTVQVNLDFASEADMAAKLRASFALQPIASALFAASPFLDGKVSGALTTRSDIWRDTDNQRAGVLPFVFEEGFGFEHYVEWALDVPMYFVKRGDTYHDVTGTTFRQYMAGALKDRLPGIRPEMGDWVNHLGTLFPDARLKRFIEQRGADCGPRNHILGLPAFWVGLLYDEAILDEVGQLIAGWTAAEVDDLRDRVPAQALKATFRGRSVQDWAKDLVELSSRGLMSRARRDSRGRDERIYLQSIAEIADSGVTLADRMLAAYASGSRPRLERLFADYTL